MPRKKTNIREDILHAIEAAFPEGVVELSFDPDDDQFTEQYVTLREELGKIGDAVVLFERAALGDPEQWPDECLDPSDAPLDSPPDRSYDRFFLALRGEQFKFISEDEEEDEDGNLVPVERSGTIGCLVGVSAIAPVAVIRIDEMEQSDEYGDTEPDVFDHIFSLDGEPMDMEQHYGETFGDEAVASLHRLCDRIARVLQKQGIVVIPNDELNKRVPWLTTGEDVILGSADMEGSPFPPRGRQESSEDMESAGMEEPITVRDAFFFMLP